MKKIVVHSGFHPEIERVYNGEHIWTVVKRRGETEFNDYLTGVSSDVKSKMYKVENNTWIKDMGDDKYVTDWNAEERWGRVEELELDEAGNQISAQDIGFVILRVDRSRGIL